MNHESLKCIPTLGPPCDSAAEWHVWYATYGGVYTYYCSKHLAVALLIGSPKIVQIDPIEATKEAVRQYHADLTLRARRADAEMVCWQCGGHGVVGLMIGEDDIRTCSRCGGKGRVTA